MTSECIRFMASASWMGSSFSSKYVKPLPEWRRRMPSPLGITYRSPAFRADWISSGTLTAVSVGDPICPFDALYGETLRLMLREGFGTRLTPVPDILEEYF